MGPPQLHPDEAPEVPRDAPRVGQTFGHYRVDGVVGVGGMGMVFQAHDLHLGRSVALKVVLGQYAESDAFLERFQREAAVLARLDSPHVVSIYDHGEQQGWPFIVTQYAAGGDLGRLLAGRGAMPPGLASQLCAQVADALVAAHAVGVVHRDVKPANVLLRDDRLDRLHVYLCDFGVALTEASGLTSPGSIAGTWNYMAPERVEGEHGSPASDIYAVGCLFYETLTGRPPYVGSDVEVAMEHVRAPVPQLPGTDEFTLRANQVLARTMAKDPRQRYPTAAALRDDLRSLAALFSLAEATPVPTAPRGAPRAASAGGGRGPSGRAGRPVGRGRGRRTAWIVGAVVAVLVAVGGGVAVARSTSGGGSPSPTPTASTSTGGVAAPGTAQPVNRGWILGDLDADGHGDAAWTDFQRGYFRLSDGRAFSTQNSRRSAARVPTLLGDVNGDGHPQLVTVVGDPPSLTATVVSPRNDTPTISLKVGRDDSNDNEPDAALADVTGDGKADLVVATNLSGTLTIWVAPSVGDNRFGTAARWFSGSISEPISALTVADLNGDGRDDLGLVTIPTDYEKPDSLAVLLSDGSRLALSPSPGLTPFKFSNSLDDAVPSGVDFVGFADVDGDGQPELVAVSAFSPDVAVWQWDGTGFGKPRAWYAHKDYTYGEWTSTALVDADGDGKADLLFLKGGALGVLRSTGSAFVSDKTFTTRATIEGGSELVGEASPLQQNY